MRLTFRLEDGALWACDDEGRSRRLDPDAAEQLAAWWDAAPRAEPDDGRTAAVLADLGQARVARPHPTGRQVDARVAREGEELALGRLAEDNSRRLSDVLDNRRSARIYGTIGLAEIATLLVRSARVVEWTTADDNYQATHRPAPSAGGRHPFDLYLVTGRNVDGLDQGVYALDAGALVLVAVDGLAQPETALNGLGEHFGPRSPPAAAVYLVAHLDRTLSRYPAGMSLVWRDAGALLQTLHLVATDIGLRSCIAGTCGTLVDEAEGPVIDVGCLALGGRPHS